MILGLGIDLCEIYRIDEMLERWGERFARKVFTEGERHYAEARHRPGPHLAARFAVKEATLKALAVPRGLRWHDMEVVGKSGSAPILRLSGRALEVATERGVESWLVSITHSETTAAAVVIAEGRAP